MWGKIIDPVDLESARIKKKDRETTDAAKELFRRVGGNNITRQFSDWFVRLNPNDPQSIRETIGVDNLRPDQIAYFASHMNRLHVLLLSVLEDDDTKKYEWML